MSYIVVSGGVFEESDFFNTLIILIPSSFLVGVIIGAILERYVAAGRRELKQIYWVVFWIAFGLFVLLAPAIAFIRE